MPSSSGRRRRGGWRRGCSCCSAGIAFGLAALGLFSLVALDVAYRRREFAIRLALGSPAWQSSRACSRVPRGASPGVASASRAFAAGQALRSLLFGIAPGDLPTSLAVLAIVIVAVAIAAWVPARRAVLGDPHGVLRES